MSGFEVVGVILAVLPGLGAGLKECRKRAMHLRHHEVPMDSLIMALHVEHSRLLNSWTKLLFGLIEDDKLHSLLEEPTEKAWQELIDRDVEMKIERRLGHRYHSYVETMKQLRSSLGKLGQVVGFDENTPWYRRTVYHKLKRRKEMRKCLKDCLNDGKHERLLADIKDYNNRLEQIIPGSEERADLSVPKRGTSESLESIRRSASSLYCALCSHWLCECEGSHTTHFQLRASEAPINGLHRFKLMFELSKAQGELPILDEQNWHEVQLEVTEDIMSDAVCSPDAIAIPGRVGFVSNIDSRPPSQTPENRILDICTALRGSASFSEERCIGFLEKDDRRHYMRIPARQLAQPATKHAVSLQQLLCNSGTKSSRILLRDKLGLAFLLASSLLQLYATPWLEESWSSEDIYFVSTQHRTNLGECAYITKRFPTTVKRSESEMSTHLQEWRSMVVRNEAIFRLGAALVELSTSATLQSQVQEPDCNLPGLSDVKAARRISKDPEYQYDNVPQWNRVVNRCLHCDFDVDPDFSKKIFRERFYQDVVAPLQKLAEDVKSG